MSQAEWAVERMTSSFRLWHIDRGGGVLTERRSQDGVQMQESQMIGLGQRLTYLNDWVLFARSWSSPRRLRPGGWPGPPQRQDEATHKVILKLLAEEEAKASTLHKQK